MKATEVVADTYFDYERLIYHTVNRFIRKYGGDVDEYVAEANYAFMRAFNAFDASRGNRFSTLLVVAIWNRLIDLRNDRHKAESLFISIDAPREDGTTLAVGLELPGLVNYDFASLTDDARTVLGLVLDAPMEVLEAVAGPSQSVRKEWDRPTDLVEGPCRSWESAIIDHLRSAGWAWDRIAASFRQIGQVLAA